YHWEAGFIRAVEFAPLERESEVAGAVAEGIAQVRAGLWRAGASTFAEATAMAPDDADVRWMAHLATRIAEGRLAHAGSEPQPLLTQVLAGEYETAVDLMRPLPQGEAFSADGPLIAGTAAEDYEGEMGALLVEHASRAIEYDAALGD